MKNHGTRVIKSARFVLRQPQTPLEAWGTAGSEGLFVHYCVFIVGGDAHIDPSNTAKPNGRIISAPTGKYHTVCVGEGFQPLPKFTYCNAGGHRGPPLQANILQDM